MFVFVFRDELVGIEGHVKITNPDDYEINEVNGNVSHGGEGDRGTTSLKRSLPDLPVVNSGDGNLMSNVSWEPNGDTASELYETVGLQQSNQSSVIPSTSSAKRDHPYDKLKTVEHPYAQVHTHHEGPSSSYEGQPLPVSPRLSAPPSSGDVAAAPAIAGLVHASDDLPYMTPPTHFSGDSQDSASKHFYTMHNARLILKLIFFLILRCLAYPEYKSVKK